MGEGKTYHEALAEEEARKRDTSTMAQADVLFKQLQEVMVGFSKLGAPYSGVSWAIADALLHVMKDIVDSKRGGKSE